MPASNVKKFLQQMGQPQLVGLLLELYKKHKPVAEILDFYAVPDEQGLYEKYRQKVTEAFYPKHGFGLKMGEGKKAISEFRKFAPATELLLGLMLHYVETGVRFTIEYGDIDAAFYNSLENTFMAALKLARKEELLPVFQERVQTILYDARNTGWGFHQCLSEQYAAYYEPEE